MQEPLVSIVLTSYNQPELLKRAFDSLIVQTYKNIEIIIVDDCSTNPCNSQLIESFKLAYPDRVTAVYHPKNIGIPANKNSGFRIAKGEFITYLDGDDIYYENKVAFEIQTFYNNPGVDIVYSNFDIKNMNEDVLSVWASDTPAQGYIFKDIILNKFPDCHTHRCEMFKRHVLHDLNFYDEQFSAFHDLDFMLRYSLKYKVAYNNYIGSSYFKNPESINAREKRFDLSEQQEEVYKKYTKEIKEYKIERAFNKYLNNLKLDRLFWLDKIDYPLLFQSFIKHPLRIKKFAKILNFLYKKKSRAQNTK